MRYGQLAGDDGRHLMGWDTRADGAIVLAYRQGGGDGAVRAESREPTLGSDRGLSAPPLRSSLSCSSRSSRRRGRRGPARACCCAGGGRRGRVGRGDGDDTRRHHAFIAKDQSSSALPSHPTSPPSSPPISQPSTGRRRTLDQPRHAGSPPPQPRYTHHAHDSHLLCELHPDLSTHTPVILAKGGRFAVSSVEGGAGEA